MYIGERGFKVSVVHEKSLPLIRCFLSDVVLSDGLRFSSERCESLGSLSGLVQRKEEIESVLL